ncbi:Zn-ribbon domain-containing OB-fold protein [Halomarina halobia]|uniref:Zn-ribbon domain-containing OB-fold protein n=1 Tax=Halomarina halobia TaxID=3033386 RepID=A0ABD6ADP7_9EURY|nr:OB-fold domain-containing protein [Halomarina sp. PSR21]
MTWEPRPVPDVTPETAPFWEGAADGRFLLCECEDCGLVYYYPRLVCPDCLSGDVGWIEAAGTGDLYSYTVTDRAPGWPEEALPLIYAYVELDEGPRVITDIVDCDPTDLEIGQRVEVRFVPTDDEAIAIPVFAPVES